MSVVGASRPHPLLPVMAALTVAMLSLPADRMPAIAFGSREIAPLDLAAAYATFANDGVYNRPTTIARVTDASGNERGARPERRRAISSETARGVSYVLQSRGGRDGRSSPRNEMGPLRRGVPSRFSAVSLMVMPAVVIAREPAGEQEHRAMMSSHASPSAKRPTPPNNRAMTNISTISAIISNLPSGRAYAAPTQVTRLALRLSSAYGGYLAGTRMDTGGVTMGMGISIFLIAVGAVVAFAVQSTTWSGVDVDAIGIILMIVGVLGVIASTVAMTYRRSSDHSVVERRDTHSHH